MRKEWQIIHGRFPGRKIRLPIIPPTGWAGRPPPKSSRFRDLVNGDEVIHDTRTAILWYDDNLDVGFWVEEPAVAATLTERDDPIYKNNDVEVFIAGQDTYYEFEINAFGTIYEVFFI